MSTNPGSQTIGGAILGQNPTTVTPNTVPILADAGSNADAMAAAQQDWQNQTAQRKSQADALLAQIQAQAQKTGSFSPEAMNLMAQRAELLKPLPPPDPGAIQAQADRQRLLGEAAQAYGPLISGLQSAAAGQGPSSALNAYKAAADDSAARTYGDAASGNVSGGQRGALFQAAMAKNAQMRQQGAMGAATIGAQEQNQARSSLGSALAGLTNIYGTELYGGTQAQQGANQNAQNTADQINANISSGNASNLSSFVKSGLSTAGTALSHA